MKSEALGVSYSRRGRAYNGFTLIETSIVLVIVGLIVGGVLVGPDFIGAASAANTAATRGSATTCYDNGNAGGAAQRYSTAQTGNMLNCALSFRFQ